MSGDAGKEDRQEINYLAIGMSVGMIFGGVFGILYGILLDNMALMTVWVGGGLVLGLSIGAGLEARRNEGKEP
jgi:F0F1-type ATP synthase assembly protein I